MNLLELQDVLGERVKIAVDKNMSDEDREKEIKTSESIARLAKQMINNADIILRTDKMRESQGVKGTAISRIVGYKDSDGKE